MKKKCKLLSFDSSTKSTGYALFVNGKYSESGRLNHEKDKNKAYERSLVMMGEIIDLLNKYNPDIVTIELPHFSKDAQTHLCLGMIIGAVVGYCIEHDIFYYPVRASEWRSLIGPYPKKRDDVKTWGIEKTKELFNIDVECDDESDAILMCQAYVNKWGDKNE